MSNTNSRYSTPPVADFSFPGGIKLKGHKAVSTRSQIINPTSIPDKLVIPLRQHMGHDASATVSVGDKVKKGQILARSKSHYSAALHAPTSGTISALEDRPVPHPSGLSDLCIEITSDGNDTCIAGQSYGDDWVSVDAQELRNQLQDSGIVGLGGATFPTAFKIQDAYDKKVSTLVVNGAECEPWISCDQALMQEEPEKIIEGISITMHLCGATSCIVGIEDNKPDAIAGMVKAAAEKSQDIKIISIPTIYPTGGERQLIKVLTNKAVPESGFPADIGMLVLNIATIWAVRDFIKDGNPLTSRVVTVTGDGVQNPCNIRARIGTPMSLLIKQAGGYSPGVRQLSMGGPMMGYTLEHDDYPVVKACNCLLAQTPASLSIKPPEMPCIRCAACAESCPMELLPQQLFWYTRAKKLDALERFSIQNCITCGVCDYVCPSHIPLSHYFRFAKSEIKKASIEQKKADIARQRHEARQERLERIKREKAEKLAAKKAALAAKKKTQGSEGKNDKQAAIAEALARAQKRKEQIKQDKLQQATKPAASTQDGSDSEPAGSKD